MKKILKTLAVVTTALTVSLAAGESKTSYDDNWGVKSVIGFEGGFGKSQTEITDQSIIDTTPISAGIKVGAEGQEYRILLNTRYYFMEKTELALSVGATVQYLFRFTDWGNLFLGVEAGGSTFRFRYSPSSGGEATAETGFQLYYGGNAGLNFDFGDTVGLEVGGRYMAMDNSITNNGSTIKIPYVAQGYASIMFKYVMD